MILGVRHEKEGSVQFISQRRDMRGRSDVQSAREETGLVAVG